MKKTYEVFLNESGNPYGSGLRIVIYANSEFEAIQSAKRQYPNKQIASIKEK